MAEVQQFVLKHVAATDILQPHRDGYPYHIIMERSTGKTMDVFIEVQSQDTAAEAVDRNFRGMKFNRLGQRMVNLELSSQAQLLRDLFPRARSIVWDEENNGAPYLVENTDPYSSGFNGFMTSEELNGLIRHAETPSRVCTFQENASESTLIFIFIVSIRTAQPATSLRIDDQYFIQGMRWKVYPAATRG